MDTLPSLPEDEADCLERLAERQEHGLQGRTAGESLLRDPACAGRDYSPAAIQPDSGSDESRRHESSVRELSAARDRESLHLVRELHPAYLGASPSPYVPGTGGGSHRQQRALCAWEFTSRDAGTERAEPSREPQDPIQWGSDERTEIPQRSGAGMLRALRDISSEQGRDAPENTRAVYDLINAGPRHRFTANGIVISNCRLNAWNAGQDDLIQAFREGRDAYREFAAEGVYHCPLDEITASQRQVGKTGILSLGYMTGAKRFREMVRVDAGVLLTQEEAKNVVDGYRGRYTHIKTYWDVCRVVLQGLINGESFKFGRDEWLVSNGVEKSITLPSGRKYYFPNLRTITTKRDGQDQQAMVYDRKQGRANRMVFIHPGMLTAMIIQGMSRDLLLWQGAKIAKRFPIVQQVYDAHAALARKEEAEDALAYVKECMLSRPGWLGDVPLKVDAGYAANLGDA